MSGDADRQPSMDGFNSRSPGARLKAAREAQGQLIDALARTLNVSPQVLLAMETDAFTYFDAPVFARGYLRQYAGYLRLPVDEIIAAYDELASVPGLPSLIPPMSVKRVARRWPKIHVPAWVLIVCMVIIASGVFWLMSHQGYRLLATPGVAANGVDAAAPADAAGSAEAQGHPPAPISVRSEPNGSRYRTAPSGSAPPR